MTLKSTKDRYGAVVVAMHWITAVLIVILIASGFRAAGTVDPAAKLAILRVHVPVAITVLALTILRIGWWWRVDRKPDPVAGSPRWQEHTARAVHVLLYIIMLVLIASGIAMMAQSGAAPMSRRGAARFCEIYAAPAARHGRTAPARRARASRSCGALSPFHSARRPARADVVQHPVASVGQFVAVPAAPVLDPRATRVQRRK